MVPRWVRILFVVFLVIWFGHRSAVEVLMDWYWFDAASYGEIFTTKLVTKTCLWGGFFVAAWAFLVWNLRYCVSAKEIPVERIQEQLVEAPLQTEQINTLLKAVAFVITLLPSLLLASMASTQWLEVLSYINAQPFNETDTLFRHDLSFYFFELPVYRFLYNISLSLVILTLLLIGSVVVMRDIFLGQGRIVIHQNSIKHFLGLGALLFLILAVGWYLERYELLFSKNGAVWGAGYTDINARLPAFYLMLIIAAGGAVSMLLAIRKSNIRLSAGFIVVYMVARLLLTNAWPSLIQSLMVEPNELEKEKPFLMENIKATRKAYALDRIEVKPFDAKSDLTLDEVNQNELTKENIRIWDDRPLLMTYGQLQEIRTYYDFVDVDVDRYMINGKLRQVMLSGRELNYNNISKEAMSWVNQHFQYTHGYGLTMSPVNVVTEEGLPELFIQDIPPKSNVDIEVNRPEIYYGEKTNHYIMVGGSVEEFDYPQGDKNKSTTYKGKGGIKIDSFWRRMVAALYFQSLELVFSQYITNNSKLLFRRNIEHRIRTLAPFLYYDRDPYMVVADGKLYWMVDAYTLGDRYPYAEPVDVRGLARGPRMEARRNYWRNSVKVVIDAYHGDVKFYISDAEDPLIKVYSKIFPNSFQALEKMPQSLQPHIRYPVDFFNTQAMVYYAYHMEDPTVFYNKEDMWTIPWERYGPKDERPMDSYYLIMKLPSEQKAEFILLRPLVPTKKDNMISWLAARSDKPNYGKLILYQFPKQKLIYGPRQIEARIDQDPNISQEITLWSKAGSEVWRGNLLVIPIEDSLIYVEPLYLQAVKSSQLPELKRVIVSYDKRVAMEKTLDLALAKVFGVSDYIVKEKSSGRKALSIEPANYSSKEWQELANEAHTLFADAEAKLKQGDWAGYGSQLKKLSTVLTTLKKLSGSSVETPDKSDSVVPVEEKKSALETPKAKENEK